MRNANNWFKFCVLQGNFLLGLDSGQLLSSPCLEKTFILQADGRHLKGNLLALSPLASSGKEKIALSTCSPLVQAWDYLFELLSSLVSSNVTGWVTTPFSVISHVKVSFPLDCHKSQAMVLFFSWQQPPCSHCSSWIGSQREYFREFWTSLLRIMLEGISTSCHLAPPGIIYVTYSLCCPSCNWASLWCTCECIKWLVGMHLSPKRCQFSVTVDERQLFYLCPKVWIIFIRVADGSSLPSGTSA